VQGSGYQHVTADWEHKVTGTDTDDYGTWVTKVGKTWTATAGGAISVTSTGAGVAIEAGSGEVAIKASVAVKMTAPKVEHNTVELAHKSNKFQDFYVYKGATGLFKTDHAAIYQSAYGIKIDAVAARMDMTATEKEDRGLKATVLGTYIKNQAIGTIAGAMLAHSVAFTKL
jgi:type VI secretion system secreted protein VgrG